MKQRELIVKFVLCSNYKNYAVIINRKAAFLYRYSKAMKGGCKKVFIDAKSKKWGEDYR
jgi:hypothetical protein